MLGAAKAEYQGVLALIEHQSKKDLPKKQNHVNLA